MKKSLVLVIVCAMLSTVLAACTPTTRNEPDAPSENVFRYGFNSSWPDTRNPLTDAYAISGTLYRSVLYEPLVDIGVNNEWDPRLAVSWSTSEDGLRWIFNLRQDVKWHDGEEFSADDVVYTYKTIQSGQMRGHRDLKAFIEVNKLDQHTVEIVTEAPKADMILPLTAMIVPEHIFGKMSLEEILVFENPQPVGTGPFRFVSDSRDQYVEYVANDEYWGGRPGIDRLMFVRYSSDDTMYQALAIGQLDYCVVQPSQEEAAKKVPGLTVLRCAQTGYSEVAFNMWSDPNDRTKPHPDSKGNPLILDKTIRHAIDHAINYEYILEYAEGGIGVLERSIVPRCYSQWWVDFSTYDDYREYNPQKARDLLESAGYIDRDGDGIREDPNGNKLDFRFSIIEGQYRDHSLIIQQDLKQIGINANIEFMDSGRLSEIIEDQGFDTDMFIWGWGLREPTDPSYCLSLITTGEIGGRSDCFYSNPEYDALYTAQASMLDYDERYAVVKKAQEIAYDDAPYLILDMGVGLIGYNTADWTGFVQELNGTGGVWNQATRLGLRPVR